MIKALQARPDSIFLPSDAYRRIPFGGHLDPQTYPELHPIPQAGNAREGRPAAARLARTTPVRSQQERLDLVRELIEADNVTASIRIAGLIFLLYGIPIVRIAMLTIDDVIVNGKGMFLSLGRYPAPIPEPLAPMFLAHIQGRGGQQTVNRDTRWLFPGVRAGAPDPPTPTS